MGPAQWCARLHTTEAEEHPEAEDVKILTMFYRSQALVLCFRMHFAKDATTTNTAAATIRQLVSVVFERVVAEDSFASGNGESFYGCYVLYSNRVV